MKRFLMTVCTAAALSALALTVSAQPPVGKNDKLKAPTLPHDLASVSILRTFGAPSGFGYWVGTVRNVGKGPYGGGRTATLEYREGMGPWKQLAKQAVPPLAPGASFQLKGQMPGLQWAKGGVTYRLSVSAGDANVPNDVFTMISTELPIPK